MSHLRIRELARSIVVRYPIVMKAIGPFHHIVRKVVNWLEYKFIFSSSMRATVELVNSASSQKRENILAFMTVRNELSKLSFCLQHHRSLGVKEFFIVDNGSIDGTYEYLLEQSDVTLFRTNESYRNAHYGITWVNFLIHKYAQGRWALFIDADELLYFDGMEHEDAIQKLVHRLEKKQQTYFYAPMVDLYAFDDLRISEVSELEPKYRELNNACHDISSYKSGEKLANELFTLKGGPRSRLLEDQAVAPNLVKFPLVKVVSKSIYIGSSHEFYPPRREVHTDYGWLVHLKLGNNAHEHHSDPEIEKEHYGIGAERRVIASGAVNKLVTGDPQAINFNGRKSLNLLDEVIKGRI